MKLKGPGEVFGKKILTSLQFFFQVLTSWPQNQLKMMIQPHHMHIPQKIKMERPSSKNQNVPTRSLHRAAFAFQ